MQNSAIKTLFCNIKQKINHSFDGEKHMKRRIFTTLDNLAKRDIFDAKYAQLEKRRENLDKQIRREEREAKIVLAKENVVEFTAKAKKYAKKQAKKAAYDAKYLYVAGGHAKNEFLGWLTIFSFHRSHKVKTTRFVRYDDDDKRLYLDFYERKDRDRNKKARVFVYIHGGGWIGGLPETREAYTTKLCEKTGYFVASLYYGEAPFYGHPEMIQNVYKAFAWLKEHADEYNIDMDRIFVGGESAGAHLSSMAGAISTNPEYAAHFDLDERSKNQRISALMLNCGVYDFPKAVHTGFKNIGIYTQSYCKGTPVEECSEELQKEISPINWVTKDFPPTFAISAENDKLAVLTFDLVKKLQDLGVSYEHYHGEGKWAVHAFPVAQFLTISQEAMKRTIAFLNYFEIE